jgi:hypothetical protein
MTILIDDIEDYTMGVVTGFARKRGFISEDLSEVVVHVNVALESILASDLDEFDTFHLVDFIVEVLQGDKLTPESKQYIANQLRYPEEK